MNARVRHKTPVVILLGSNIRPEVYLPRGMHRLRRLLPVQAVSSVWQSSPVGTTQGEDFLNAAVKVWSPWGLDELKTRLRALEAALGRVRTADKFAPRTLDLDIVVWDGRVIDDDVWRYAHAAVPVAEVWPDLRHPQTHEPLALIAQRLQAQTPLEPRHDMPPPFREPSEEPPAISPLDSKIRRSGV